MLTKISRSPDGRLFSCLIVAAALLFALTESSVAVADPVFPLKASADGRYLVDGKNKPFFYHADTAWALTKKLNPKEVAEYLDDRLRRGFNVIHVHAVSKEQGPMTNWRGEDPFVPADDITKPNEPYWKNVEDVLDAAQKRNLLVAMSALWIRWGGDDREGWRYQLTDENARQYGRFLGKRFGRFDNLIWILGGDANPIERTRAVAEIGAGIKEHAPRQLITVHNRPENSSSAFFHTESWLDVNFAYTYGETYIHVLGEWNRLGNRRPMVLGESGYEDEDNDKRGGSSWRMRRQVYGAILSGSLGGHAFGQRHVWRFDERWRAGLDSPASREMSFVKQLFATRAWYKLIPDEHNRLVTDGRGRFGSVEYVTAARTPDKNLAFVYFPIRQTVTVDLDQLARPIKFKWFDPTNGTYGASGGSRDGGRRQFTPPGNNAAGGTDYLLIFEN